MLSHRQKQLILSLCLGTSMILPLSPVAAFSQLTSNQGHFIVDFYDQGESFVDYFGTSFTGLYTLSDWQKTHVLTGFNYWEEAIRNSFANNLPIHIYCSTIAYGTASVNYWSSPVPGITHIQAAIQGYEWLNDFSGTIIDISQNRFPAKEAEEVSYMPIPHSLTAGNTQDLDGTIIHELGHSLGIASLTVNNHFIDDEFTPFESHLYDWRGVQAKAGMEIQTLDHTATSATYFDLSPSGITEQTDKTAYFYVPGGNVAQVLDGAKQLAYTNIGTTRIQSPVPGVPVLGYDIYNLDLSHLELRNGLMSHQVFRNYMSFMEVELAVLQDLGYTIDRRNYFGRSVYGDGLTIYNTNPYYARDAAGNSYLTGETNLTDFGMGLHIYGSNNTITQAADLLAGGKAGVGIRVDGTDNTVVVASGTNIQANGLNGNGLLVAFGKNHNLTLESGSTVSAGGTGGIGADFDFGDNEVGYLMGARGSYATRSFNTRMKLSAADVGVDGPLVENFTIRGALSGTQAAIYMSNNAYVKNIILGTGAHLSGAITNDWLYDYDDVYAYGNRISILYDIVYPSIDANFYRQYTGTDELTTKLSFANENGMAYDGSITGAKNTRLAFDAGITQYTGIAKVLSVEVAPGATLTSNGTFTLTTPTDTTAHTLDYRLNSTEKTGDRKLTGVGIFTNKGRMAPTTGNITINGDFVSTGTIGAVMSSPTQANAINISGSADLTGSKLTLISNVAPLVGNTYNYLTGSTVSGTVTPINPSPYVTLIAGINGSNAYFSTARTNVTLGSLPGMTSSENSVGAALEKDLQKHLANDPTSAETAELNNLLFQNEAASRAATRQITNVTRSQLMTVSPLTPMTVGAMHDRLDTALYDGNIKVTIPTASFDGVPGSLKVSTPITLDAEHNLWFKLLRGFESYGGTDGGYDLHNKSFGGVIGYDKAVNGTTRVGGLFSYAKTDYTTDVMSGDSHDWRIGVYASHDNGTWKTQGLIAYGQNRYDFNRYVLGDKLSSDYKANVLDINAKVKYLPQQNRAKSWQVAPYVDMSYTHSNQGSYDESGRIFAQSIDSASNNSWRAEGGVEWKHNMDKTSSWGGSVGYKRVLSGVNPELNGTFVGDNNRFTLTTDNDKDYFTYSLNLRKNTGHNWTVQGEIRGEKSAHNHSEVYSLMAKYSF